MYGLFFDGALSWLAAVLLRALQFLWQLLAGFALTSPDVTVLPQVQQVSARSVLVVDTVYVLLVLAAAVLVMTRETVQVRYGIGDLAPRLVIGLVGANLGLPLSHGMIEAANALTAALTGDPITSAGSVDQLTVVITSGLTSAAGTNGFLVVLISMLLLVLTVMLLVAWLTRVGLLVVLAGLAPAALACHGLPHTEVVARLWWRSMTATLSVVTLQAFVLHTTLSVFLSPQANLPALGLPLDPPGTINLFIVACLLWVTVRIPALAGRYVTRSPAASAATVLRVLVVQAVTRGVARGAGASVLARAARARP